MLLSISALAADTGAALLGRYEGDAYINECFGLAFNGAGWDYESEADLTEENGLTAPLADDAAARSYVTELGEAGEVYCDMTAYARTGDAMVVAYVEYMTPAEMIATPNEEMYADMTVSSLSDDESYENVEKRYGLFLGEEHPCVHMVWIMEDGGYEYEIQVDEYYIFSGDFMFTAVLASYDGEALLADLAALWSPVGTDGPQNTGPAADLAGYLGRTENGSYINDYFGIGFDCGSEWSFADAEELAQFTASSSESLGALLETDNAGISSTYDMLAYSSDGQKMIYVGILPIEESARALFQSSESDIATLIYTLSKSRLESLQAENLTADCSVNSIRFLGEETNGLLLNLSVELQGRLQMNFHQQEMFLLRDGCLMNIYLVTYTDDADVFAEMADLFYTLP